MLAGGRTSRLQHALVEEEQICVWVSADLSEGMDASMMTVTAEVVPGVEPARVEARVLELLADAAHATRRTRRSSSAAARSPSPTGCSATRRSTSRPSPWGMALALFDLEYLDLHLERLLATDTARLLAVAERYLRPERGSIVGWSLPKS